MSCVAQPAFPLHEGFLAGAPIVPSAIYVRPRRTQVVRAPITPLHGLGYLADAATTAITAGAGIAAKVTPGLLTSSGAIAAGSAALPIIGTAIAVVGSIIAGLWAAHEARAKGARTENAAVSSAVTAFDGGMRAIFAAANSPDPAQNISASQASQLVSQLWGQFWQAVAPFTSGPGRADASNLGTNCGGPTNMSAPCSGMPNGHKCDKSCTVSCCVGCQDIKPAVDQALAVFAAGGGSVEICTVFGDRYGLQTRAGYTLTYSPPAISPAASLVSELTGGAGPGPVTGGGSILPLALMAAVAFLALRD
jgi:hypothetical protein